MSLFAFHTLCVGIMKSLAYLHFMMSKTPFILANGQWWWLPPSEGSPVVHV